jgi:hypothetical protein
MVRVQLFPLGIPINGSPAVIHAPPGVAVLAGGADAVTPETLVALLAVVVAG